MLCTSAQFWIMLNWCFSWIISFLVISALSKPKAYKTCLYFSLLLTLWYSWILYDFTCTIFSEGAPVCWEMMIKSCITHFSLHIFLSFDSFVCFYWYLSKIFVKFFYWQPWHFWQQFVFCDIFHISLWQLGWILYFDSKLPFCFW